MPTKKIPMDAVTASAFKELKEHTRNRGQEWVIFLGAGVSAGLGFPPMAALVEGLSKSLKKDDKVHQLITSVIESGSGKKGAEINIEDVLRHLYQMASILEGTSSIEIRLKNGGSVDSTMALEAILYIKTFCKTRYEHPPQGTVLTEFLRFWMSAFDVLHIFTTNWDNSVEFACDEILSSELFDVRLCDGFKGTRTQIFDPSMFESTDTGQYPMDVRVVKLYKLHGSIDWTLRSNPSVGKNIRSYVSGVDEDVMIFPSPRKHGEILGFPYLGLHRLFADALEKSANYMLAIGTSFPDEHINLVIANALRKPTFNLFVVNPALTKADTDGRLSSTSTRTHEVIRLSFEDFVAELQKGN